MKARNSIVIVSIAVGIFTAGCSSDASKDDPAVKKAFMGGPMPKGFMEKNGPAAAGRDAGQKAAQEAAAKAAAANAGK